MLEFRRATDVVALTDFFVHLKRAGEDRFFQLHPLTHDEAQRIVQDTGRDLYVVAADGSRLLAYGLVAGWQTPHETPSLGMVVLPAERGTGVARAFVAYLHAALRRQGAARVRLKVSPENCAAKRLYEAIGYVFTGKADDGEMIGVYDLIPRHRAEAG